MQILKAASALFCAASAITILTPTVFAQHENGDYNRKTTVTFNNSIEIPGAHLKGFRTLPAGTYVFKLMDSTTNRHIVQIQSADEKKTFATILAIPNTRIKRTDNTVVTFTERPNGEPPALRAWFYPVDAWGEEFVYGKSEAKQLAKANNTPVLYGNDQNQHSDTDVEESKAPNSDQVMAASAAGDDENMDQAVTLPDNNTTAQNTNTAPNGNAIPDTAAAPVADNTPAPAPAPAQVADATPPASSYTPPAPAPAPSAEPATLPQTASPFGVMLLGGLFALGGAIGVRLVRQNA